MRKLALVVLACLGLGACATQRQTSAPQRASRRERSWLDPSERSSGALLGRRLPRRGGIAASTVAGRAALITGATTTGKRLPQKRAACRPPFRLATG